MSKQDLIIEGKVHDHVPACRFRDGAGGGSIAFTVESGEVLRLDYDGNIYVHGRLVENDKRVVDGLRHWLQVVAGKRGVG